MSLNPLTRFFSFLSTGWQMATGAGLEGLIDERIRRFMSSNPILQPLTDAIAALQTKDTTLQGQVEALASGIATLGNSITAELKAVRDAITKLQAIIAQGGTVSIADVQALADQVTKIGTDTDAAVAAIQEASASAATGAKSLDDETAATAGI